VGDPVFFKLVITNKSLFRLTDITLDDSVYPLGDCNVPDTLRPGRSFECIIGPVAAAAGQQTDTSTVTGKCFKKGFITLKDCDSANYYGFGPEPAYHFQKYINGVDADSLDMAVVVDPNDILTFRYEVTNIW